ncbi:autotransporter domain-containing protein [Sphingomonas sp. PB2P12]|uniref:autotransporter domain-containing protein n=1 Tax=Sphingomonas sandaracina TaxID=3096157 RepID=UPI002FCAAACA
MLTKSNGASLHVLAYATLVAGLAPSASSAQQAIVVRQGTTDTTAKTVGGTDTITVEAGGTLAPGANPAINWSTASSDLRITNAGTIRTTAAGARAINASGARNARTVTLTNAAGGLVESQDDAFRINVAPTSGTIRVDNYGIIRTTNGGQALDFDAVAGDATVIINNYAGAELRSFGQDAIRPGQGAIVTNAGLIISDGPANNNYDGIDWQARSGSVINQADGTISGLRHGITSDTAVTVDNAGTILGRNGSGIGSDGTGTVVNSGTITGRWDGVAINGDGDGVDIDFIGSVTNSGTIQGLSANGVDSGGRTNSAEGIAMGGGTIVNTSGATIFGAGNGILINHDTNAGGVADGATTITNAGTIAGGAGRAITLIGNFADTITNSGTITGGTAGAIDMGGGDDILNIDSGSVITGTVDGGAGTDTVRLGFPGLNTGGSFAGAVNFEKLQTITGDWTLSGPQAYANGIEVGSGTTVFGNAATLSQSSITTRGLLTINEATNTTYTGTISGNGAVSKTGAGNLSIGAQTFTGGLNVTGGTLTLTGQQAAFGYYVGTGATLTSSLAATVAGAAGVGFIGNSVTNLGTVSNRNANGRAIDLSTTGLINLNIGNEAGALIESANDAIRIAGNPRGANVSIRNSGTIRSTNGGQAIDFDAIANGSSIEIINTSTGIIQSFGQDAIRPGQGAIVTNAGLIFSDGPANNSYDGIDWQARSGVVNNQASGTISGLRHGITSDATVTINNAGTILGRNGSGVGSDGTGAVVNGGTITGRWDGVAINGDGDGVDIDFIGSVTNSGTIQGLSANGVDSGGRANSAEGIAMGGGTIVNTANATIFGAGTGILINHDTNAGGVADGATTIGNAGTIRGGAGRAITFVGAFNDTITNSGTITGGSAGAIDMGDGNDTLNILSGSIITGTVVGGAGIDRVNLGGNGGSFGATTGFEALAVNTGSWTLTAPSTYANGTTIAGTASLIGDATTLTGGIANAGTLVFDQRLDGTAALALTGTGQLVKIGSGALTLGSQSGFTGATAINAGRLVLAGSLPTAVTVGNGATLGGVGTIAGLVVATGGTVAPGNSPGTIAVTGNFAQASGSTYLAETSAAGLSDRIVVGGTATLASGAILTVTRDGGAYTVGSRYTLLTADGGITGAYTVVQVPTAGTEFRTLQSNTAIAVAVARTASSLSGLASTRNQAAVAPAFAALGVGNAAYAALTLVPDDVVVRDAFDDLSGEVHATVRTTMLRGAQTGEEATRNRLLEPDNASGIWGQMVGQSGSDDGESTAARATRSGHAAFAGVDVALDGARLGVAGGYTRTDLSIATRGSDAEVETKQVLGYAGGVLGPVALRTAVGYAWTNADVTRGIAFPGFAAVSRSKYDGDVLHGFVEAGLPAAMFGGTVEPFAGIEHYRVHTDGFAETSSAVALIGRGTRETFTLTTLGIRGQTPITEGLSARSRIGWQHALDDVAPRSLVQFASGGQAFQVSGAPLSRDAALVSLDLAWQPAERLTITSGYSGSIGGASEDNRFRVTLSLGL